MRERLIARMAIIILFLFTGIAQAKEPHVTRYTLTWPEFSSLSHKEQLRYIGSVQSKIVELEKNQVSKFGKNSYAFLDSFLPRAWAATAGVGSSCIYAGHMSQLVKSGSRLVCERPGSGACAGEEGQIECNPVFFGAGICTPAGSLATYNCSKNSRPVEEIAQNLNAENWGQIEKINSYCNDPLAFQKLICDKFYKDRLNSLLKIEGQQKQDETKAPMKEESPKDSEKQSREDLMAHCLKLQKNCVPKSQNYNSITSMLDGIEASVAASDTTSDQSCSGEDGYMQECGLNAVVGVVTSLTMADEIYDLMQKMGIDTSFLYESLYEPSPKGNSGERRRKQRRRQSPSSGTQGITGNSFYSDKGQEINKIQQILDKVKNDKALQRKIGETLSQNIEYGIIQGRSLGASTKKSESKPIDERCRKMFPHLFPAEEMTFSNNAYLTPMCQNLAIEVCNAMGSIGGDVLGLFITMTVTVETGGASSALLPAKLAKLFSSIAKYASRSGSPSIMNGMLKMLGSSDEIIKLSKLDQVIINGASVYVDSAQQYFTDMAMCRMAKIENRCASVTQFTKCVGGLMAASEECLGTIYPPRQ